MDFEYNEIEILNALREITKLGPIDQLKLKKAYHDLEKDSEYKIGYIVGETTIDEEKANKYEIQLRMLVLAKDLKNIWKKLIAIGEYRKDLSDYVKDYLKNYLDEKESSITKKI